jgi:hypothetical protein
VIDRIPGERRIAMRKTLAVFALVLGVFGLGIVPALAAGNCGSYTQSVDAGDHGSQAGSGQTILPITQTAQQPQTAE